MRRRVHVASRKTAEEKNVWSKEDGDSIIKFGPQ